MNLNITKPIAFFDLETTGVNVTSDRIVEICVIKVNPDGKEEKLTVRINPQMEIPKESSEVHGIYNKDIEDCPTFAQKAKDIAVFIGDADLAGYNSNKFDVPVLAEEFLRAEKELGEKINFNMSDRKFVDVQNIFHKMEQRTLVAAYKFYCEKDLTNAHSAEADVLATYEVLKAQVEKYSEIENDVDFLAEFSRQGNSKADFAGRLAFDENEKICYNFGKHKGKTVEQVAKTEPGYYGWMMNSDFPLYTKKVLKEEIDRIKALHAQSKIIQKQKEEEKLVSKLDALKSKFGK
ncbi:MAG: exonuclease domain-containing protein [Lishizhenia sp.]